MKKFFKFVAGVATIGALACGVYYFCKKYICKETPDDFDDFDDDLDDYDTTQDTENTKDNREYVSINITSEASDDDKNESDNSCEKEANANEEP